MLVRPYVVTFDVTSDRRRTGVGRLLGRYGPRVLRSVYDVAVPDAELSALVAGLRGLLGPADDLLLLPRCASCRQAEAGAALETVPVPGWVAR